MPIGIPKSITRDEAVIIVEAFDFNGKGKLMYNEFAKIFKPADLAPQLSNYATLNTKAMF